MLFTLAAKYIRSFFFSFSKFATPYSVSTSCILDLVLSFVLLIKNSICKRDGFAHSECGISLPRGGSLLPNNFFLHLVRLSKSDIMPC